MPVVKPTHIISFSSEDKNYQAKNLLNSSDGGKWKCEKNGERSASLVMQLEKAVIISSIDIGNFGSAFVEVLVNRSARDVNDFQVLLNAAGFMNSSESRMGTSIARVRMFDRSKFSEKIASEKWDQIKCVCSQPFNKNMSYGLSFITIHYNDEKPILTPKVSTIVQKPQKKFEFGAFKLRKDEPVKISKPLEEVRRYLMDQSHKHQVMISISEKLSVRTIEEANDLIKEKQETKKHNVVTSSQGDVVTPKKRKLENDQIKPKQKEDSSKKCPQNLSTSDNPPKKKKQQSRDTTQPSVKFDKILKDVVFVLSGFVNPLRHQLRQTAIDMGAKYSKEWNSSCTHLICAFKNTPKFKQVRSSSSGVIVKKSWIESCASERRKVPTSSHLLVPASNDDLGDDVIDDVSKNTEVDDRNRNMANDEEDQIEDAAKEEDQIQDVADKEDQIEDVADEEDQIKDATDDDKDQDADIFDADTDVENEEADSVDDVITSLPELPEFFSGFYFYICKNLTGLQRRFIRRIIISCGGKVRKQVSARVSYVISDDVIDEEMNEYVEKYPNIQFVNYKWIVECGKCGKLEKLSSYILEKSI